MAKIFRVLFFAVLTALLTLGVWLVMSLNMWHNLFSARLTSDVRYVTNYGIHQFLDLHRPRKFSGRLPVVLWIHGGAWISGSKDNCPITSLTREGFAVISMDYRFAAEAQWPAQLLDARAAIRWICANEEQYGLDADRIGVAGSSAGAHLAAMLALTADDRALDSGLPPNLPAINISAVCWCSGPSDLILLEPEGSPKASAPDAPLVMLFGGPIFERRELLDNASPLNHIHGNAPPFLLLHGDADDIVNYHHSRMLFDALSTAGVETDLQILEGVEHGMDWDKVLPEISRFFGDKLK